MKFVLTCEHGGNNIVKEYEQYFNNCQSVLATHQGYDIGALDVFNFLKPLSDYSKYSTTSRLLIELNRSLHHKNLFSEYTKTIPLSEKQNIIDNYYLVYRNEVEAVLKSYIDNKHSVIHISVHSFTPVLNNIKRNLDIGLLYDSKRKEEKSFCKKLKEEIINLNPTVKLRYNYPYLGKADGFTTYLRKQFSKNYIGIELEINQKFSKSNKINNDFKNMLFDALSTTIES